jgi:hypothetical protein
MKGLDVGWELIFKDKVYLPLCYKLLNKAMSTNLEHALILTGFNLRLLKKSNEQGV